MIYRHGDLLIRKVEKSPKDLKIKKGKSCIVARGEATGHHHKLKTANGEVGLAVIEPMNSDEGITTFIEIYDTPAELEHQEHKTITLDPGTYEVTREQEHDYFLGEARRVQD